jgi:hypothetical protein
MKISFRAAAFAIGVSLMLLSARTIAKADEFQFSFATDPVGCGNYSGGCGALSASGIFTTGPVTQTPAFGAVNVFVIEGLTGMFNGLNMTLNNPGDSAIFQSTLNLPFFGPGVIFTAGGTQYELEFNEGPHPAGADDLLVNLASNSVTSVALSVSAVSVPEASTVVFAIFGLFGLVAARRLKLNVSAQRG